jgi:hypothetical protein
MPAALRAMSMLDVAGSAGQYASGVAADIRAYPTSSCQLQCSSLLLMISFSNPSASWYKAALCSSLSPNQLAAIVLSLVDSLLANIEKDHYRTYERLSAATEAQRSARSRSPPDLLAMRQSETMPGAQDLQAHSPHRCVVHLLIQFSSTIPCLLMKSQITLNINA